MEKSMKLGDLGSRAKIDFIGMTQRNLCGQ